MDVLAAPANVTNVLTVTNVRISDNGADYICAQGFNERSDTVFLTVFGEFSRHIRTCVRMYVLCEYKVSAFIYGTYVLTG